MSAANFKKALSLVLVHEGGFVDHPRDPGGATNFGVTQAVYDAFRRDTGKLNRSVREIESEEVNAIYRTRYWDRVRGDDLPSGVDYCVFDFGVNSGTNRAAKYLQRSLGIADDGAIGPVTILAAKSAAPAALIDRICDRRLTFLRSLDTFDVFGRGWTRRVEGVRAKAKGMA